MKRNSTLLMLLALMLCLSGCGRAALPEDGRLRVVCTIFPQYDWVREIAGDNADQMEITLLPGNRIDMHSFQPSVGDMVKISSCDLFIYVGGESESWVDATLSNKANDNRIVLNLIGILGDAVKEEEILEGMEAGVSDGKGGDETETTYDEHVWLSLKNAKLFCGAICSALSILDESGAAHYKANAAAYTAKLQALDDDYSSAVGDSSGKVLLFCDRFPFRYLANDYGLTIYAAFPGCSAETEASFDTIVFLAEKIDELRLKKVIVTESADRSLAETVINNTAGKDQQILMLNAMQSVTPSDINNGATYLAIMQSNLEALKQALR